MSIVILPGNNNVLLEGYFPRVQVESLQGEFDLTCSLGVDLDPLLTAFLVEVCSFFNILHKSKLCVF